MKVYVASSWRNVHVGRVVEMLRVIGHEVYDFRDGKDHCVFKWSEVDPDWQLWDWSTYVRALESDLAVRGFQADAKALEEAQAVVLVLPCGASAHLELGYAIGKQKFTVIYRPPTVSDWEPELMYKFADRLCSNIQCVGEFLDSMERAIL